MHVLTVRLLVFAVLTFTAGALTTFLDLSPSESDELPRPVMFETDGKALPKLLSLRIAAESETKADPNGRVPLVRYPCLLSGSGTRPLGSS